MALMNIENWISVWVQFDYFPREVKDESRWTGEILQEICPQAQEWELVRELSCLSVPEEILWRPYQTLSKGEQTKAQLAACFLREGKRKRDLSWFPMTDVSWTAV